MVRICRVLLTINQFYIFFLWLTACHYNNPGPLSTKRTDVLLQDLVKSRSREIGCNNDLISLKYDRNLGSAAAEVAVKFQSDWKSLKPHLAAMEIRKFAISHRYIIYKKTKHNDTTFILCRIPYNLRNITYWFMCFPSRFASIWNVPFITLYTYFSMAWCKTAVTSVCVSNRINAVLH